MTVCYRVRMNVRTNLMLPEDLVAVIDEIAGPRGRSRYVAEALAREVRRDRQRQALEETFGTLSGEDYPQWKTPDDVVEWVRERRSETTDPGPEDLDVPDPRLDIRDRPPAGRPRRSRSMASDVRGG